VSAIEWAAAIAGGAVGGLVVLVGAILYAQLVDRQDEHERNDRAERAAEEHRKRFGDVQ
jgi:hypothetical protein